VTRLLVTGAGGQLGRDVVAHATAEGDDVFAFTRAELDMGDRDAVQAAIVAARPDVVVNAAAWTAVDACESDPARAMRDNADSVQWVREACDTVGAQLVHVSTDYVFDGMLDRAYREDDATNPLSVYGRSKLAGELAAGPDATIVRTSWVCGEHGANMVKTVLRFMFERPTLSFVADQRGCPTFTADLAPLLRRLGTGGFAGVYHATNQGAVSWFEFVQDIVEAAGGDRSMVLPITTAGVPLLRHYREPLAELVRTLTE
jgi:dTDP-4-dehydrorhamnose reductase